MNIFFQKLLTCLFLLSMPSIQAQLFPDYFVDFDTAMLCNPDDALSYQTAIEADAKNNNFFSYARAQYTKYIIEQPDYCQEPRIPKKIHQIWVGPNTPPVHFKTWQESLLKLHPDWEYKLWTDEDVKHLTMINQRHYDAETNYGAKADILRLELLNQFGGVYVDIDFKCIKPFDPLHHLCDFYIGFFQAIFMRGRARINNGIFAATQGHPLIKILIEEIGKNRDQYPDLTSWSGILARNGPDFVTRIIHTYLPQLEGINIIFPSNYFYPWSGAPKNLQLHVQPETIAIHYFASSWDPKVHDLPHLQQLKQR
ncbi:MAG: glycosyltransferase family 32 protein [Candidatus Babeliales bacterium]